MLHYPMQNKVLYENGRGKYYKFTKIPVKGVIESCTDCTEMSNRNDEDEKWENLDEHEQNVISNGSVTFFCDKTNKRISRFNSIDKKQAIPFFCPYLEK